MYKGESTAGIMFYDLLIDSEKFTSELGKITLASGKLEAELIKYLLNNGVSGNFKKATLGTLIRLGEDHNLLDQNMIISLKQIAKQRNYLTHNIYALFTDLIEETILEKNNLLDSDVELYIDKAWQLKENLEEIAKKIKLRNR